MEGLTRAAWLSLAVIHAAPAATIFAPSMIERLYGLPPTGDLGILIIYRGALFFAVMVACVIAAFHLDSRKLASVVVTISMLSFLYFYARAGLPSGPLRRIAIADMAGLVPLAFVLLRTWR